MQRRAAVLDLAADEIHESGVARSQEVEHLFGVDRDGVHRRQLFHRYDKEREAGRNCLARKLRVEIVDFQPGRGSYLFLLVGFSEDRVSLRHLTEQLAFGVTREGDRDLSDFKIEVDHGIMGAQTHASIQRAPS